MYKPQGVKGQGPPLLLNKIVMATNLRLQAREFGIKF
jgi:hypothetical protein